MRKYIRTPVSQPYSRHQHQPLKMSPWKNWLSTVLLALLAQPFSCAAQDDTLDTCRQISDQISSASSVIYACKSANRKIKPKAV